MISICMIVKNEEKYIEQCLRHLLPFGYEIIVVDTGSTDNTRKIASGYTDKIYDFVWIQDFAAARNYAIDKASKDYVLFIDSDETVTFFDKKELERLVFKNPEGVGRLIRINDYFRGDEKFSGRERVSRLFPKHLYKYEGIIHEQIVRRDGAANVFYDIPIEMHHEGYEGDLQTRRKKTERNITLLKKQLEEGEDPYIFYQLGKSYYMQEDYILACEWFEKALSFDLDTRLEYVQDMVESYGYALLNSKQFETALQLLNVYDEFAVNADFIYLAGLIYMNNAMFDASVNEFIKAAGVEEYKMDGVNSYRAFYNIGVIYECLGNPAEAKKYYVKCGEYKLAKSRLEQI